MKIKIFCFLLIIPLLFSIGCKEKIVPIKLDEPVVYVDGNTITWEYNTRAVEYEVRTNLGTYRITNNVWVISENLTTFEIRCIGDGKRYKNSNFKIIDITNNLEDL